MLTILEVISSMNPTVGGPCQGIRDSIGEFVKLGVSNEVVCLDDPTEDFISKDSFTIHALGPNEGPWSYNARLLPWLIENLTRFDVVIMHGLWLYPSYAVRKAIKRLKQRSQKSADKVPKFFIMPHGMLDPYFQQAKSRKFKALRNWIYWKLIEHKVVNEANGLLFTSETELCVAREPFQPYHPKEEINVGYGIQPPPLFTLTMRSAFKDKCPNLDVNPYFLFLSRINDKKGVDLLLSAYANLLTTQSEMGSRIPKLVIAGPGLDSTYGQTIRRLVLEYPMLQENVFFPGMLSGDAKWGAIYGCEAFVLPSHQENFGIAVVEALACSKPVLISNQVNIWREVEQGGSGIIDDDSLAGTQRMLEEWVSMLEYKQQEMAENARKTYETYFQMKQVILRLNDVFNSLTLS